ncbi:MAG: acyl-CoA dehydrogenase [Myxococcales bacterium]|nr:MAG: acyl-CoA dehydrogenase [Myxococcales bacterium]
MDFELNEDQRAIIDAVEGLLARHAGPARAIGLAADGAYDAELDAALCGAGFMDVALGESTGALEAALVVEAVSRRGGVAAVAAQALVVPGLCGEALGAPVALAAADQIAAPVRFAEQASYALIDAGEDARLVEIASGTAERVDSNFGFPMGRLGDSALEGGRQLGLGSGARLRAWWRVALAAEALGAMESALEVTVDYLKQRRQFGRTIASFQAVQHRLAECKVLIEGSRWLTYEAAWLGAPDHAAAVAAAHTLATAGRVFVETHQLSGAIGFTREHDLHVWSMRLQALRLEMYGVAAHRRAATDTRWV